MLGDDYSVLLAEEQKILKEEFNSFNAEILGIAGDGFFVAFQTTKDAVECAASIQKKISRQKWINGSEVKIRIGIHTGDVKISITGYTGIAIHTAERIMSAGYGGQVLISEAAKILMGNELSKGIGIKYLGEYNLKDLDKPEKIYQLVIEGVKSEFPLIQSLRSVKTNLTGGIVKLIGREKELNSLKEILSDEDTRLVTITGPGGMGKSSLGLNVCRLLLNSFKEGVYAVFLSSISDPELVAPTIGKAFELSESADSNHLIDFLGNKNLLLFLDNFEQVIEASDIIMEIISNCPRVKILVTSRIILHIKAEIEFPLNSLSLPEEEDMPEPDELMKFPSVQLFADRAKSIDKNFELTNENAGAIAKICIRLDGLPLAIELASARIKLFTPQMLLSRLSNRLNLLKGTDIDLPERHQTLRQTILWSYDLLSEKEKKLFEMMSVFVGGSTLKAIENVCMDCFDNELELFDSVEALLDKSLLRRSDSDTGEIRFIMLLTIREFSNELFTRSDDYKKIKDKHSLYFTMNAEEAEPHLIGEDIKHWSDILDADMDNYRAALKWSEKSNNAELALRLCASLSRFWIVRKNLNEGYEKMKYVLSMSYNESQKPLRAKVLNGIATIAHELNNFENSYPLIEDSLKIYREIGDEKGELYSRINLLWVLTHLGDIDKAEELAEKCLRMSEKLGEERAFALIYNNLGWINFMHGNLQEARNNYLKGLDKRIELGDKRGVGFLYTNVGWVEAVMGYYDSAEEYLKKSLQIHSELSDKHLTSWALSNYALLELYRGNFKKAEEFIKDSICKIKESVSEWGISYEILLSGIIQYHLNDKQKGIENIIKSLSFYRKIKSRWGIRRALLNLGIIYSDMGDFEKSKECLRESLEISIYLKDKIGFAEIFENTALIFLRNGDTIEAKRFYEAALTLREKINAPMNYTTLLAHKDNLKKLDVKKLEEFDLDSLIKSVEELK
jgi:predicted ATPase